MPEIDQNERVVLIEWNENIHIQENRARINHLMEHIPSAVTDYTASIGQQQFLLNRDRELSSSEAELYFKTERTDQIPLLETAIRNWLHLNYPMAVFSFSPPENIFEKLFTTGEADLVAEIYSRNTTDAPEAEEVYELENILQAKTGIEPVGAAFDNQLNIMIDRQKLLLYNVSYEEVYRTLKTAFKENEVTTLRSYQQYVPITIGNEPGSVQQVIHQTLIQTISDEEGKSYPVPLRSLVTVLPGEDLKTITAGKNGEYIPFSFFGVKNPEKTLSQIKAAVNEERIVNQSNKWDVAFSGSYFANKKMLNELVVILFISILLMYFILAAQFESFLQPLIVLCELPIDIAIALLALWFFGHTLNLMSAIGIVVTCGIIINDSILKLDAINELRKQGVPLTEAIHEAGRRRLRPIIMTSLTTIFAMVPLLFTHDMGSELQKPLSIAMISTMIIGTLVSLFIIPLVYWWIYRGKEKHVESGLNDSKL